MMGDAENATVVEVRVRLRRGILTRASWWGSRAHKPSSAIRDQVHSIGGPRGRGMARMRSAEVSATGGL